MISYTKEKQPRLKVSFEGDKDIECNHSQAYQDIFVLMMLGGKKNGTYLEIGANEPIYINNSYLLEKKYGWRGVSIDYNSQYDQPFKQHRTNELLVADALEVDYEKLLNGRNFPSQIDYLQIDIEPPNITFECLKRIPFDRYRFSVITFETDYYDTNISQEVRDHIKNESRRILESHGYILVSGGVCGCKDYPFEDWYIDPTVISPEVYEKILTGPDANLLAEEVLLTL